MTAFATLPQNHPSVNESTLFGHAILSAVSTKSGISVEDLKGPRRYRHLAWPRHLAIYLMRRHCLHLSTSMIGRIVGGRDHTTVLHAMNVTPDRLEPMCDETSLVERCDASMRYYIDCCNRLRRIHAEVLAELGLE